MSKSVIETLKELVKANGNQAAAIWDAVIEALEQGGGGSTIEGEAGQVVVCDGNGGAAGSDKLVVSEGNILAAGGVVAAAVQADAVIAGAGGMHSDGNIVTPERLISGDSKGHAGEIRLFDDNGDEWSVKVVSGQLTCTQVQ